MADFVGRVTLDAAAARRKRYAASIKRESSPLAGPDGGDGGNGGSRSLRCESQETTLLSYHRSLTVALTAVPLVRATSGASNGADVPPVSMERS